MDELTGNPSSVTVEVLDETEDTTILAIAGVVDIANVGAFEDALSSAAVRPGVSALTLDLEQFVFMDSTGIGALLRTAAKGVRIELRQVAPLIREIVTAAGLADVLHLESDS